MRVLYVCDLITCSEVREERLGLERVVVSLSLSNSGLEKLHGDKLEALSLEAADDFTNVPGW